LEFLIRPLKGIGDVEFGMNPTQVKSILGAADSIRRRAGKREEHREGMIVRYADDAGVVEFAFYPESSLLMNDKDLFRHDDPVGLLLSIDPSPMESLGFLVFLNIGVCITGFHDGETSQRSITTFVEGYWDIASHRFTPFSR